jgi:hypothetical protein
VRDALLEPEHFGVDGDGGIGYGRNVSGAAEDFDDINGFEDVFQACVGFFAEHFSFVGIDGDDAVAGGLQVSGDFMAGAGGVGRKTDHRDGFGGAEELGDGIRGGSGVVRKVKEHGDWMMEMGRRIEEIEKLGKWKVEKRRNVRGEMFKSSRVQRRQFTSEKKRERI